MRCAATGMYRSAGRVSVPLDTSTYHYKSRRPGQALLEQRIREICQTRVRYGYRRVHVLLRREGWPFGQNQTRRIYRKLGLQLLQRRTPAWGNRPKDADNATEPRWRCQPATVIKAEKI